MKRKSINKTILSFFISALWTFIVPTNIFAKADPGEYQYLCNQFEDEDFIEAYTDLLEDLNSTESEIEIECAKEYGNSFNRFKFKRDEISKLPGIMKKISNGISVFAPGGCEKLIKAMNELCREEYEKFKGGYSNIPTNIYGSGDREMASKKFCDGKYETKLSRQGEYIIVKNFQ